MKLWILTPRENEHNYTTNEQGYQVHAKGSPWRGNYDMNHGFVIAAETEQRAREIAADCAVDEGREAWLDSKYSDCSILTAGDSEGVIIADFHAG